MHTPKVNTAELINEMADDQGCQRMKLAAYEYFTRYKYSYNFTWLGRPIIQYPQDIVAIQEILFEVQPELVIETGVAHGGSLILSASVLQLMGAGDVIGVDIDIRAHNRRAIEEHFLAHRITLIEGDSTAPHVLNEVNALARGKSPILVFLDSNHTRAHVAKELAAYSPLVTKGSYLVVFDTVIEDIPDQLFPDRPWNKLDNPKTAVREFLVSNDRFVIDEELEKRLLLTAAPSGFLKCVKE